MVKHILCWVCSDNAEVSHLFSQVNLRGLPLHDHISGLDHDGIARGRPLVDDATLHRRIGQPALDVHCLRLGRQLGEALEDELAWRRGQATAGYCDQLATHCWRQGRRGLANYERLRRVEASRLLTNDQRWSRRGTLGCLFSDYNLTLNSKLFEVQTVHSIWKMSKK